MIRTFRTPHRPSPRRDRRSRRHLVAAVLVTSGLLAACSSDGSDGAAKEPATGGSTTAPAAGSSTTATAEGADDVVYPGEEWGSTDPEGAGFDPAALARLEEQAKAAGSDCLVVTKDGEVVDEQYWKGDAHTPHEAFSVTKSITSFLVGIAQDQGKLELGDPADEFIPEWKGTDSADVTLLNLLSNDSGRFWSAASDYGQLLTAQDQTAYGVSLDQQAAPGSTWAYNNSAIQTLSGVLDAATGEPAKDFAETNLFEPTGMADSDMGTDGSGGTQTFMGLKTTCLDLARFGYLALHEGRWEDEQVVSADFVFQATRRSSTELNAAYGLLWWLNHRGQIGSPAIATTGKDTAAVADGQLVPGAPENIFWALGFNNQIVAVMPSEGIVAVRMGAKPPADAPFTNVQLTNGVLDALDG